MGADESSTGFEVTWPEDGRHPVLHRRILSHSSVAKVRSIAVQASMNPVEHRPREIINVYTKNFTGINDFDRALLHNVAVEKGDTSVYVRMEQISMHDATGGGSVQQGKDLRACDRRVRRGREFIELIDFKKKNAFVPVLRRDKRSPQGRVIDFLIRQYSQEFTMALYDDTSSLTVSQSEQAAQNIEDDIISSI
jgi:hypothetical protein